MGSYAEGSELGLSLKERLKGAFQRRRDVVVVSCKGLKFPEGAAWSFRQKPAGGGPVATRYSCHHVLVC